jgi:hypothetical protein
VAVAALEVRLEAKMNAQTDALAAQLAALTDMSQQLLLVVTAQVPKTSKVAGATSVPDGKPRQKRRKEQRPAQGALSSTATGTLAEITVVEQRPAQGVLSPTATGTPAEITADSDARDRAVVDIMAC